MDHNKKGQLYYSPRILPDDENDNENDDDCKVNKSEKYMKRFIHSIVREEKDKFNELLSMIDLNGNSSQNSWTPLIWAIQKDRIWAIRSMFKTNQIIDFSKQIDRKLQRSVLHFAAEKDDIELIVLLLNKDKEQQHQQQQHKKIEKNIHLDINATDREHSTALFRAAKIGAADIVKLLLENNADPNITNRDGISPLLISAHRGYLDVVEELINCSLTDINLEDERGRTPLMVSCAEDRKDIVKILLKCNNINLNAVDIQNFNWNCLMWCVYRKNETILNLLLSYDQKYCFNYFHEDLYGKNSLEMCVEKKLSKKSQQKLRKKYHSILFPKLIESELVVTLKIPVVVIGVLLVFTY